MAGKTVQRSISTTERIMGLQPVAPYIVLFMFILSIVFSILQKSNIVLFMWGLFGVLGIFFLYVAYPRSFYYGLWLLATYILCGVGIFFLNVLILTGPQGLVIGSLLLILGAYIIYNLIIEVKMLRNTIEGKRIPLGLFSLGSYLFFFSSLGALGALAYWINSGGNLYGYVGLEIISVLLVLFVYDRMELCVMYSEEGPMAVRRLAHKPAVGLEAQTQKVLRSAKFVATRTRKAIIPMGDQQEAAEKCPICSSRLKVVLRSCPNCDEQERTAVCEKAGHVFIPCPSCGKANFHADYRCKKCNAKLSERIFCRKCGKEADLVEWHAESKVSSTDAPEEKGSGTTTS
jgi:predicted RNA-binding Zn-ribbon protein involved in translation (DUF1610 family)